MKKWRGLALILLLGSAALPAHAQGSSRKPSAEQELAEWRARIDSLDQEIVALLNRRAEYVLELAPLKREIGVGVQDSAREELVLQHLREANQGPLPNDALEKVYRAIMAAMRELQTPPGHAGSADVRPRLLH
jgi:chorismate mutase